MITKLNLLATFGALILFALPWLDIQCSQRPMITQTGLQTITGGGTLAPEFMDEDDANKLNNDDKNKPAAAILVGVALAFTILAFILALASAFGRKNRDRAVGLVCAVAFTCLLTQIIIGFPIERDIANSTNSKDGAAKHVDISKAFGKALVDLRVQRHDPLYIELVVLGIPALLLLNTLIDKRRNRQIDRTNQPMTTDSSVSFEYLVPRIPSPLRGEG